jgi:hypothetical protein
VAVADFANETRDPELDGLSGLLITSLEQSRKLRVMTRGRMIDLLRQAGKGDSTRIDEALARDAGRRAGVRALLVASIQKLGDTYAVELRALDPERDEYLFTLSEKATAKNDLLPLMDRLSERVRHALQAGDRAGPAVQATSSLEAWRHYFEALRLEDAWRAREALAELRLAVKEDPDFALAHLRMAIPGAYFAEPVPDHEAAAHLRAAATGLQRLPPADRLVAEAELAWRGGRTAEANGAYERLLALRPDDKRALLRLAWMRAHDNGMEAGRPLAEQALALDPAWVPAQEYAVVADIHRGDLDGALRMARDWSSRWPSAWTLALLNTVHLARAETAEAMEAAQRAAALSPEVGEAALRRTLLQRGEFEELDRLARRSWEAGYRWDFLLLPHVAALRGRLREAAVLAGVLEAEGLDRQAKGVRASIAGAAGDTAGWRAAVAQLGGTEGTWLSVLLALAGEVEAVGKPATAPDIDFSSEWRTLVKGLAAAERRRTAGDVAGARRDLEALEARLGPLQAPAVAFALARVCLDLGDHACSAAAEARFQRQQWVFFDAPWTYPASVLLQARSLEALGQRREARDKLDRLLALWSAADPDLPHLAEARALCARVGCRAGAAGGGP